MEAMDKIRDELAGNSNPGVQMIGEAMTALLMAAPELSDKILQEGKTLAGAFNAVKSYASQHKTGGFAFVPPAKAAEIVAKYWGIDVAAMKRAVLAAEMETALRTMYEALVNDFTRLQEQLGIVRSKDPELGNKMTQAVRGGLLKMAEVAQG